MVSRGEVGSGMNSVCSLFREPVLTLMCLVGGLIREELGRVGTPGEVVFIIGSGADILELNRAFCELKRGGSLGETLWVEGLEGERLGAGVGTLGGRGGESEEGSFSPMAANISGRRPLACTGGERRGVLGCTMGMAETAVSWSYSPFSGERTTPTFSINSSLIIEYIAAMVVECWLLDICICLVSSSYVRG